FDGLCQHIMRLIPAASLEHKIAEFFFPEATARLRTHGFGEQSMIAIPLPRTIEGNQEQLSPLQLIEKQIALSSPGDSLAERSRQTVQETGLQQKLLERLRLSS